MENWIEINLIEELLGLKKSMIYDLKKNKRIKEFLKREIRYVENPLRYNKEDIMQLIPLFKGTKNQQIVTIVNHKGGVGKTTSAINLGQILSEKGYLVLLIDLDFQGTLTNLLSFNEDGDYKPFGNNHLYNYLKKISLIEECIYPTRNTNLYVLPSHEGIIECDIDEDVKLDFKKDLKELKHFNYIIFDTPPYYTRLTNAALNVSTDYLIPAVASQLSMLGLEHIKKTTYIAKLKNKELNELGIFYTMFDPRLRMAKVIAESDDSYHVYDTKISKSQEIENAYGEMKSIYEFNKEHKVSIEYQDLVKEIWNV